MFGAAQRQEQCANRAEEPAAKRKAAVEFTDGSKAGRDAPSPGGRPCQEEEG